MGMMVPFARVSTRPCSYLGTGGGAGAGCSCTSAASALSGGKGIPLKTLIIEVDIVGVLKDGLESSIELPEGGSLE